MTQQITFLPSFESWQAAARSALRQGLSPDAVYWEPLDSEEPGLSLFGSDEPRGGAGEIRRFRVPRAFPEIARRVACHRDERRWALLYRVLWRLTQGEPKLLEIVVDPDVVALERMDKAVRTDVHKMRAFVRFREVRAAAGACFVAWFEPAHLIVELNAPFFVDRFAQMRWSILTPDRCAHWDCGQLTFTAGVSRSAAPSADAVEELWREYYAHIFNPARVKVDAMMAEMPKKYWRNLPEAAQIPSLIREAPRRVDTMIKKSPPPDAAPAEWRVAEVPATSDLAQLRAVAAKCTACPLHRTATQTVFGEGPGNARVVLLGEQPGDQEDRDGHPFVGPAGLLLNRALNDAGLDRKQCYVTNVVKHFKWEPRGKRRIHQKPGSHDIAACRPWFEAELASIRPPFLICLGATAAQAVFGPAARVTRDRGAFQESPYCARTLITVHPSSLLRAPDEATREQQYALFVADLALVVRQTP